LTEGKAVVDYLKKALFIYTANVCRSPMAKALATPLQKIETSVARARAQE
jgi:protein-tyrosine-phosphatase